MALVLQHRVKKLLASQQSMASTKNLVDNLQSFVPVDGMANVSEIRTNLKSQLDNASLGVAEGILSDMETMLASIHELKEQTEAMDGKCKHILAFLDATERTSNAFVAQAGALSAEKIELQQELEESKQFLAKYQVDPLDIALLEAKLDSTDEAMSVFFEVLDRVDQIKANCKQLVEENPVSTSMEFLEKVCQHQDAAFDKLYQWTIHHCGSAENEPSRLLHHAIRFLKARTAFYVHCKEVIISARRAMIVRRFVTALTRGGPNGIPRPIEIHSHDPVRYAGDMLAWIHSSIASENEYFKVLFDGEDNAELQKLVGLAFEGVARPLEIRLEQTISSQGAFLVIYQVVHLLGFYCFTINKLIDPTTELVLILQGSHATAQASFAKLWTRQIDQYETAMHEERTDFSLAATHSTMDITHKLAGLLDIYQTALLPNGPQTSDIALFLDGFIKTLQAVSKNRHADLSDSLVFQINQLGHVHAMLSRYEDLTSQWNVELHQELFGSLQSLALMQAAIILKRCAAAALIERLNNSPDNASTQPGLDESSVKVIVHNFCTCLMSLNFPAMERISQPDLRDQAYTATAKQLSDAYAMLYQLVCDPRCGYADPTSIVLHSPKEIETILDIASSMAVAADYSGWVKELEEFKPSISDDEDEEERVNTQDLASQYMEPSRRRSSSSQIEEIKQEMKLLNWHKLANEAALKAALIKTKKLKREDARHASVYEAEERLERLQQIQEEENMKPLEVTADFIRQYEEEERREEIRLEQKVARHINCLKKLKSMIAEREELRLRHLRYRDGKQALEKKLAGMSGNQEEDQLRDFNRGRLTPRSLSQGSSEVSKALSSLDKLVELERRISCLEQSSLSPPSSAAAMLPPSAAKPALKFTKSSTGRPTARQVPKKVPKKAPTFLTAVPEPKRQVSKQVQRASELRRMPERDRQKAQRMDRRQEEEKKQKLQNIKINQWMDKKKQAANSRKTNNIKANMRTTAAARPTTNNPHMAQFLSMKKQFEAKKASFTASKPTPPPTKRTPPVRTSKTNVKPSTDRLLPLIHNRTTKAPPKGVHPKPSAIVSTTLPSLELGIHGVRKTCR